MFDSADLEHVACKARWQGEESMLRGVLLAAQYELAHGGRHAVLVLIEGVDGAGTGETVHLLNEWMDPRHIGAHAFSEPADEEERPTVWRYWRVLPPCGKLGIFFGSWCTQPILHRVMGGAGDAALDARLAAILHHERVPTDEGVLLLKFWFHLTKDQQRKRLKRLERDEATRWQVTRSDWRRYRRYDRVREVCARTLRTTSTGPAPWVVVPGTGHRYRSLLVGQILLDALQTLLMQPAPATRPVVAAVDPTDKGKLLDSLDLGQKLGKKTYERQLEKLLGKPNLLSRSRKFHRRSLVMVFEGWDAAGKGSAIRRVTAALNGRHYKFTRVAAPATARTYFGSIKTGMHCAGTDDSRR